MLEPLQNFLEVCMDEESVPAKIQYKILLSAEEIFVNQASYAYTDEPGSVSLTVFFEKKGEEKMMHLIFSDEGVPFNPLEADDPEEGLVEDEDALGGFGIFIVKKSMSSVDYRYEDGKNVLELVCNVTA